MKTYYAQSGDYDCLHAEIVSFGPLYFGRFKSLSIGNETHIGLNGEAMKDKLRSFVVNHYNSGRS